LGRQQIVDLVNAQRAAFNNYSLTIDLFAGYDSAVAAAWTIDGVHKRPFFDFPPSGRPIRFSGTTFHRFEKRP